MATNQKFRLMRDHFHAVREWETKKSKRKAADGQKSWWPDAGWGRAERKRSKRLAWTNALRGNGTGSGTGNSVGIMQNSICNLNVFILRYAGAIFIFTENEGFTSAKSKDNEQASAHSAPQDKCGNWSRDSQPESGHPWPVNRTGSSNQTANQWASPPSIFQSYWALKSVQVCVSVRVSVYQCVCGGNIVCSAWRKLLIYKQNVILHRPKPNKQRRSLPCPTPHSSHSQSQGNLNVFLWPQLPFCIIKVEDKLPKFNLIVNFGCHLFNLMTLSAEARGLSIKIID